MRVDVLPVVAPAPREVRRPAGLGHLAGVVLQPGRLAGPRVAAGPNRRPAACRRGAGGEDSGASPRSGRGRPNPPRDRAMKLFLPAAVLAALLAAPWRNAARGPGAGSGARPRTGPRTGPREGVRRPAGQLEAGPQRSRGEGGRIRQRPVGGERAKSCTKSGGEAKDEWRIAHLDPEKTPAHIDILYPETKTTRRAIYVRAGGHMIMCFGARTASGRRRSRPATGTAAWK